MPHKVIVTNSAEDDLVAIYEYVEIFDSTASAENLLNKIEELIRSLDELPYRGHFVKELINQNFESYRELDFKPYRIIYEVAEKIVSIIAVADDRRNIEEFLEQRILR